jgi:hypothetical protein
LVAGWLLPVLIGLSILLLGRSFYILYITKRGNRFTTVVTWLSAAFVVGYWTWRLVQPEFFTTEAQRAQSNPIRILGYDEIPD